MFPLNIFGINKLELYPRRRQTEYYYEPQPMSEYQSRRNEHPHEKLNNNNNREDPARVRIRPPRNSFMRMYRNSYFS